MCHKTIKNGPKAGGCKPFLVINRVKKPVFSQMKNSLKIP